MRSFCPHLLFQLNENLFDEKLIIFELIFILLFSSSYRLES